MFRARLVEPSECNPRAAVALWGEIFGSALRWDERTSLRELTSPPILLTKIQHPDGVVAQLRAPLADLDLLMAVDGFRTLGARTANGRTDDAPLVSIDVTSDMGTAGTPTCSSTGEKCWPR